MVKKKILCSSRIKKPAPNCKKAKVKPLSFRNLGSFGEIVMQKYTTINNVNEEIARKTIMLDA